MAQPNRLSAEGDHRLKGTEIDRTRPIGFRLDGREIRGFVGDTLLSALLASGVTGAGTHDGEVLALDERFAPPVLLRGHTHDRLRALSPERTPAADGLDLVTLGQSRRKRYGRATGLVRGFNARRGGWLDLNFGDDDASLAGPWFDAPAEHELKADLAVVGGGLAGIGAALAAAKRGDRVVLLERRSWLGGEVRFFGTGGDGESPDDMVARLSVAIAAQGNITVLLGAEAFATFEGMVRVNQVRLEHGVPVSRGIAIAAPRIVLATGSIDRLPIFAGNRAPGVVGALAAFNRADRYGVWVGREALFASATNVGYRTAMPAVDAGVSVSRIADTRLDPQSRFISFAKAYGLSMTRSVKPRKAAPAGRRGGLVVDFDHAPEDAGRPSERFSTGQLVVSGGWQPDLMLWHMAGGNSRWIAGNNRLEAEGQLPGIALAGSVAGFRNAAACLASGEAAAAALFGRSVPDVADPQIDPVHETYDDPTPIAVFDPQAEATTYLDGGASLAARPRPSRRWQRFMPGRRAQWGLAEQARPLGVADVAAGVQLGLIPPDDAAIVAQERCVTPGDIVDAAQVPASAVGRIETALNAPPAYLTGRFGPKPSIWLVEPHDGRSFEPGCLVYPNADPADPLAAIGVVFAPAPEGRSGGLAIVNRSANEGDKPVVQDISGANSVRLVDPYKPIMAAEDAIKQLAGATVPVATITVPAPVEQIAIVPVLPAEAPREPAPPIEPADEVAVPLASAEPMQPVEAAASAPVAGPDAQAPSPLVTEEEVNGEVAQNRPTDDGGRDKANGEVRENADAENPASA